MLIPVQPNPSGQLSLAQICPNLFMDIFFYNKITQERASLKEAISPSIISFRLFTKLS